MEWGTEPWVYTKVCQVNLDSSKHDNCELYIIFILQRSLILNRMQMQTNYSLAWLIIKWEFQAKY